MKRLAVAAVAAALVGASPATAAPVPRAEINALLDRFVPDVLAGRNLKEGRRLVARYVTVDAVQRYPAKGTRFHGWVVDYAQPGDVGFDIVIQPAKKSLGPWSFRAEAQRIHGTWKITAWYPVAQFQPAGKAAWVNGPNDLSPAARGGGTTYMPGRRWLFAPVAAFGALLVVGAGILGRRFVRMRSRVRAIERKLASPS